MNSLQSIPEEMRKIPQWVVWRLERRDAGKTTKRPYHPSGRAAKVTDESTWCTFEEAIAATGEYDGVGFVFTAKDEYCGIDLDHVIDENGTLDPRVGNLLDKIDTYTEFSPSHRGLHLIIKAKLPGKGTRGKPYGDHIALEIYDRGRYFTMTGEIVEGRSLAPREKQAWASAVWERLQGKEKEDGPVEKEGSPWAHMPDTSIVHLLCSFPKYEALWKGDTAGYTSRSEADLALMARLVVLCGEDYGRVTTLMRQSGLKRDKWERHPDYLKRTWDRAIKDQRPVVLDPKNPTPSARLFIAQNYTTGKGRTIRYVNGEWWVWTGSHYTKTTPDRVEAEVWLWLDRQLRWDAKKKTTVPFEANMHRVNDVVKAIRAMVLVAKEMGEWVEPSELGPVIPMKSTLYEIGTGLVVETTPMLLTPYATGYDSTAGEECPEWMRFISSLWPDEPDSIDLLQEWLGYYVSGSKKYHKVGLMVGPPRSGKSTIAHVLTHLLGHHAVHSTTFESMSGPFGLASMIGKSLVILPDARITGRTHAKTVTSRMLTIAGDDTVEVNRKFLPEWIGVLSVRFLVISNELPLLAEASGAMHARWTVLKTSRSFLGKEDRDLLDRLLTELPGIFHWSMAGWKRLKEKGQFTEPASGEEEKEAMRDLSTPTAAFAGDCLDAGPGKSVKMEDVYSAYRMWCLPRGVTPLTMHLFVRDLRSHLPGIEKKRRTQSGRRVWVWEGLSLIDEA